MRNIALADRRETALNGSYSPGCSMPIAFAMISCVLLGQEPAKPFVSEVGGYRIAFPKTPEHIEEHPNPDNPANVALIDMVAKDDCLMIVTNGSVPPHETSRANYVLDVMSKSVLDQYQSKVRSEKSIKLGKYPGKEVDFSCILAEEHPAFGRCRFYLVGTRLYFIAVLGEESAIKSKETSAFLSSFALTNSAPAKAQAKPKR